jgi:hypothetical protein
MQLPVSVITIFLSASLSAVTSYVISRISQQNQRLLESRTYRQAVLIEVRALHNRLLDYEVAYETHVMTAQISGAQLLKIVLQPGDTIVFNNNASSIGLFDHRTALRVMRFYADIRALQGRATVLSEASAQTDPDLIRREMERHINQLRQARRRAHFLVRRLRHHRPLLAKALLWIRRCRLELKLGSSRTDRMRLNGKAPPSRQQRLSFRLLVSDEADNPPGAC